MFKKKEKSTYFKLKKTLINLGAILIVGFFLFDLAKENFRINVSESIPTGIYRVYPIDTIKKGDCIVFETDKNTREFMLKRGYIQKSSKAFIKKVAGMEGDIIEIDEYLKINGKTIKKIHTKDSMGNPLPLKTGKYTLKKDEFFMFGDHERSFDSSYMGIIKREQMLKKAKLIQEF